MIEKIYKCIVGLPDIVYNRYVFLRRKPTYAEHIPEINGKIYMVSDKGAVSFGKDVRINSSLRSNPIGGSSRTILFAEPGAQIMIGNGVGISNSAIHASKSVIIGDNAMIGGDCKIYDTDFHSIFYDKRMQNIGTKAEPVVIGRGAFIGAGSMILKGVHIGEESVVAAGSVVTRDIPEKELWGGYSGQIYQEPRVKVCHILNSLLPSGAETMLANSINAWAGYEMHIIATGIELGDYADTLQTAGYIIHHIRKNNFISQHMAIINFLRELKPDVVHIHRESQECYYALDARCAGVKNIVRTIHNVFAFEGYLRFRRIITRAVGRMLGTKYVAISKSVYENEKTTFHNIPMRIIFNWCDESKYNFISQNDKEVYRKKNQIQGNTMVILTVGNCSPVKNHLLLLKAIKKLIVEEEADILYYHVGSGDEQEHEINYVKECHIENCVQFLGYTDPMEYMTLADLYVMPSLYEGVGISAMEAMFCGIPCLLTDVSGLKDFKSLNNEAIYYAGIDETDFYVKLRELYIDFQNGRLNNNQQLSAAAHLNYSMVNSVHQYMEVYQW